MTENLKLTTSVDTEGEVRIRCKPLAGESVLQKNRITSLNWISIGLKSNLGIGVLNLPDGIHSIVKHEGSLLFSWFSSALLGCNVGAMEQEMFIRQTGIDSEFNLLTVVYKVVSEEIFFGSFKHKHRSDGWAATSRSNSSVTLLHTNYPFLNIAR